MAVATGTALLVGGALGAAGGFLSAREQRKAAERAARGSEVIPFGSTGPLLDQLLVDATRRFNQGQFRFGPDPRIFNSFLDFARGPLGLNLPQSLNQLPQSVRGPGPGAFQFMTNLLQGPAFAGARQTNPAALIGAPDPFAAALLGGLGGLSTGAAFAPQQPQFSQQDIFNTIFSGATL